MSFFSRLFGIGRNSRYSNHGHSSNHGQTSRHGRSSGHGDQQYSDDRIDRQYRNIMQCRQCRTIIKPEDKFCNECGLPTSG